MDKRLAEQGISRLEIGREAFIEECYKWREEYGTTIVNQIKGMGCSCDYDDEHFTLEPAYVKAVRKLFVDWYRDDLIYKGKRIVNWCPHCTTPSPTMRPSTWMRRGICGTCATRSPSRLTGWSIWWWPPRVPRPCWATPAWPSTPTTSATRTSWARSASCPGGREMPIVADEYVDMEFGTGCVKMTPAHDPNDFEVGLRHNLESIRVLDDNGKVVEGYGRYSGMDRYEPARPSWPIWRSRATW